MDKSDRAIEIVSKDMDSTPLQSTPTKDSFNLIGSMVRALLIMQMVIFTVEAGIREKRKEKEFSSTLQETSSRGLFITAKRMAVANRG